MNNFGLVTPPAAHTALSVLRRLEKDSVYGTIGILNIIQEITNNITFDN